MTITIMQECTKTKIQECTKPPRIQECTKIRTCTHHTMIIMTLAMTPLSKWKIILM